MSDDLIRTIELSRWNVTGGVVHRCNRSRGIGFHNTVRVELAVDVAEAISDAFGFGFSFVHYMWNVSPLHWFRLELLTRMLATVPVGLEASA